MHGEAGACGLILAARLSAALEMLDHDSVERITALINRLGDRPSGRVGSQGCAGLSRAATREF